MNSIDSYILQYIPKAVFPPSSARNYKVNTFFCHFLVTREDCLIFSWSFTHFCSFPLPMDGIKNLNLCMLSIHCITKAPRKPSKGSTSIPVSKALTKSRWKDRLWPKRLNLRQNQCKDRKIWPKKESASFLVVEREEPIKRWIRIPFGTSLGDRS